MTRTLTMTRTCGAVDNDKARHLVSVVKEKAIPRLPSLDICVLPNVLLDVCPRHVCLQPYLSAP